MRDGPPQGWHLSEYEGKADLSLVTGVVNPGLKLRSRSSSFSLTNGVEINLRQTPFLDWQWKWALTLLFPR